MAAVREDGCVVVETDVPGTATFSAPSSEVNDDSRGGVTSIGAVAVGAVEGNSQAMAQFVEGCRRDGSS